MAVHAAWPPLACLAMFVMIVAFIIIKYGDVLCLARSVPKPQYFERDDASSENTMSCMYDEKDSVREHIDVIEIPEIRHEPDKEKKYEYSV